MAGSKPRSESLKERSMVTNRRCVAVSDDYEMDNTKTVVEAEDEAVSFKFGAVTRRNRKTVFSVISDVKATIADGAGAFCENVSDMLNNSAKKKAEEKAELKKRAADAEKAEKADFIAGKADEKEPVGKAVKAKYSVEAVIKQNEKKDFGEVLRKKENTVIKKDKMSVKNERERNGAFSEKIKSLAASNRKAMGIGIACVAALVVIVVLLSSFTFGYSVQIGDKKVVVKNEKQLETIVSNINAHIISSFGTEAPLVSMEGMIAEKKLVKKNAVMPDDEVYNIIMAANGEMYDMCVIYAGETALVGMATEEEAKLVIDGFKNYYTGGDENVKFSTDKEFKLVCEKAPIALLMGDTESAILRLKGGEKKENVYVIQDGDTLWDVATEYDSSVDEILEINNLDEDDILSIGDEILVSAYVPMVNVTTTQVVSKTVEIPYETETVKDSSRYNTWSEITVKGVNGEATVTEEIIKTNGNVSQVNELSREVISEPVTQVRTVGTMEPPKGVGTGSFITPARGYVSSRYGSRGRGFHTGLDIAGSYGSAVCAADEGKVIFAGWSGGYGKLVKIDHQNGYVTYYAHNSSFAVEVGQTVEKGQIIAYMGSTGNSTGNHCHFEILKNGSTVNPQKYI